MAGRFGCKLTQRSPRNNPIGKTLISLVQDLFFILVQNIFGWNWNDRKVLGKRSKMKLRKTEKFWETDGLRVGYCLFKPFEGRQFLHLILNCLIQFLYSPHQQVESGCLQRRGCSHPAFPVVVQCFLPLLPAVQRGPGKHGKCEYEVLDSKTLFLLPYQSPLTSLSLTHTHSQYAHDVCIHARTHYTHTVTHTHWHTHTHRVNTGPFRNSCLTGTGSGTRTFFFLLCRINNFISFWWSVILITIFIVFTVTVS